ncbi:MAG: hypothetical protein ACLGIN_17670 [Candidatus Sericytochromatia bacterium]
MSEYLLEVKNLVKQFPITRGILFQKQVGAVHAVNGLNFAIKRARRSAWSASPAAASRPPAA